MRVDHARSEAVDLGRDRVERAAGGAEAGQLGRDHEARAGRDAARGGERDSAGGGRATHRRLPTRLNVIPVLCRYTVELDRANTVEGGATNRHARTHNTARGQ